LDWVRDPFGAVGASLPLKAQEELIDIKADRTLRLQFHELSLDTFSLIGKEEYPVIGNMAVRMLFPFSTTYLCELGVSTRTEIKT
jgi:hypothetical protein